MLLTTFTQNMLQQFFNRFQPKHLYAAQVAYVGNKYNALPWKEIARTKLGNLPVCFIERSWCFLVFLARRQIDPLPPHLANESHPEFKLI